MKSSQISKSGAKLPSKVNTFIPVGIINSYPAVWQAHCERIADFLQIPGIWHESREGITINDLKEIKIKMSHFRSTTMAKEAKRIHQIWEELQNNPKMIPCNELIAEDGRKKRIESLRFMQKG